MSELHAIQRLIQFCEHPGAGKVPAQLVREAREELNAHRKLSRVLRRLNRHARARD